MFRQSIDPKGSFPPTSSKKPAKKKKPKKIAKIKRRKRTKDRFGAERKQEEVFRFGERRSGVSGRTLNKPEGTRQPRQPAPRRNDNRDNYNPGDFIRVHNQAIKNQIRDEAESKRTGGTFTGTSIGEEKRVAEAQEADILFKKQEASDRSRFIGAVEKLVDKIPTAREPAERKSKGDFDKLLGVPKPIVLPDKKKPIPPPIPKKSKSITSKFFDLDEPTAEIPRIVELKDSGTQTRRPPEEDITFLSTNRTRRSPTPFGTTPPQGRPRPSPSNPSSTRTIPTQSAAEGRKEIEKLRKLVLSPISREPTPAPTPIPEPEPEPEPEDITEYLTPTAPSETKSVKERVDSIEKSVKDEKEQPTIKEIIKKGKKINKKAIEDLEEDSDDDDSDGDSVSTYTSEEEPEDATRIQARLETYQQLFNLNKSKQTKVFDNVKEHYRLVILEDIKKSDLGGNKGSTDIQFKKGDQHRMKNFVPTAGTNKGFNFYRDNTGNQGSSNQEGITRFNLAGRGDKKFQQAIKDGKIKIVFDEFDDEI